MTDGPAAARNHTLRLLAEAAQAERDAAGDKETFLAEAWARGATNADVARALGISVAGARMKRKRSLG